MPYSIAQISNIIITSIFINYIKKQNTLINKCVQYIFNVMKYTSKFNKYFYSLHVNSKLYKYIN